MTYFFYLSAQNDGADCIALQDILRSMPPFSINLSAPRVIVAQPRLLVTTALHTEAERDDLQDVRAELDVLEVEQLYGRADDADDHDRQPVVVPGLYGAIRDFHAHRIELINQWRDDPVIQAARLPDHYEHLARMRRGEAVVVPAGVVDELYANTKLTPPDDLVTARTEFIRGRPRPRPAEIRPRWLATAEWVRIDASDVVTPTTQPEGVPDPAELRRKWETPLFQFFGSYQGQQQLRPVVDDRVETCRHQASAPY